MRRLINDIAKAVAFMMDSDVGSASTATRDVSKWEAITVSDGKCEATIWVAGKSRRGIFSTTAAAMKLSYVVSSIHFTENALVSEVPMWTVGSDVGAAWRRRVRI